MARTPQKSHQGSTHDRATVVQDTPLRADSMPLTSRVGGDDTKWRLAWLLKRAGLRLRSAADNEKVRRFSEGHNAS
jgi:hypothetical protein